MVDEKKIFGDYLRGKYAAWLKEQTDKQTGAYTMGDYCKSLKINHSLFSQYINYLRLPSPRSVPALADVLGIEVYEKVGMKPPDTAFDEVTKNWDGLSAEAKQKIQEIIKADKEK